MGKGTDKLYITHSEWASADQFSASAGAGVRAANGNAPSRQLPYNYCALSLQPFTTPVCTPDGQLFDHENIIRWLIDHKTNPTNGAPLKRTDLIKVAFEKNEAGNYVDPVTFKEFTENSHIVAVRHGDHANAFAYDTLERLNFKPKMWKDLVSDEEFTKKDLIVLQDPQNFSSRDLGEFKYLKDGEDSGVQKDEKGVNTDALGGGNAARILKAKEAVAKARAQREAAKNGAKSDGTNGALMKSNTDSSKGSGFGRTAPQNAHRHTTGLAAASFTSTGVTPHTSGALAEMTEEEFLLKKGRVKQKGYARIETSLGDLTFELYPEHAPKAVWNFVKLAQKGYYNGIAFHRNIPNFMIQGGDPTGTGKGGQSIWGKNFDDEFDGPLRHDARGTISMANKGKNTNSSQFFITYKKTPHLDRKHTIFGRVVDSDAVLAKMERAPVGANDRPEEDIVIEQVVIFIDPFAEFQQGQRSQGTAQQSRQGDERNTEDDSRMTWTGKRIRADGTVDSGSGGVGKYLKAKISEQSTAADEDEIVEYVDEEPVVEPPKKKARAGGGFGNFDAW